MKASKYNEIHTADQLQAAIRGIRSEINSQKKVLEVKYDGLHEHYRPSNMVAGFLKKNSDYYNWADVSLRMVRALKSKVSGVRRSAKPAVPADQWAGDVPVPDEMPAASFAAADSSLSAVPDTATAAAPEPNTHIEEEKSLGSELKDAARAFMAEVRDRVENDA